MHNFKYVIEARSINQSYPYQGLYNKRRYVVFLVFSHL